MLRGHSPLIFSFSFCYFYDFTDAELHPRSGPLPYVGDRPLGSEFSWQVKDQVRCPLCSHLCPRLVEVMSPPWGQQKRRESELSGVHTPLFLRSCCVVRMEARQRAGMLVHLSPQPPSLHSTGANSLGRASLTRFKSRLCRFLAV